MWLEGETPAVNPSKNIYAAGAGDVLFFGKISIKCLQPIS